ncbi:hypothetical protein WH87_18370 [Devosia epidermidihirudinis]|uniref:N-acetyltransferase domain-containing protein n=1 Tax=Devosia epidermidihirudinis TaxID=1293439 RepID=A0A0F5Q4Z8_9HYPH|nr:GNAT family N-acetyltransferase [Devosia epidermidihirudinis]KKC35109.1 hypothetical protein WH87_18370 [Devosia epidermidihirudinis]
MTLVIRRATSQDVPAMSTVLTASITELCAADHHGDPHALSAWTRNKDHAGVTAMLANPEAQVFVGERDGAVVAVGAVTSDGMISLNYVAPSARFGGVSTALLAHLEAALIALGYSEGQLESTSTARSFYERRGWHADGPQATGRVVNGYPMRKILAP